MSQTSRSEGSNVTSSKIRFQASTFTNQTDPKVPIWYEIKVLLVAWLVLPQFRGAAFIYEKFVREQLRKYGGWNSSSPSSSPSKAKNKFIGLVTPKKGEHEAY